MTTGAGGSGPAPRRRAGEGARGRAGRRARGGRGAARRAGGAGRRPGPGRRRGPPRRAAGDGAGRRQGAGIPRWLAVALVTERTRHADCLTLTHTQLASPSCPELWVWMLIVASSRAQAEVDAFIGEIESTGTAFESMRERNQALLNQLTQRDEANASLTSERLRVHSPPAPSCPPRSSCTAPSFAAVLTACDCCLCLSLHTCGVDVQCAAHMPGAQHGAHHAWPITCGDVDLRPKRARIGAGAAAGAPAGGRARRRAAPHDRRRVVHPRAARHRDRPGTAPAGAHQSPSSRESILQTSVWLG